MRELILEATMYRGVVRKCEEQDGTKFLALIFQGDKQINQGGPFDDREGARSFIRSEITKVKMRNGTICA